MNIFIALLIFTVIVVIHELGHFLLAKKNGIGVTEFSIGMGPRVFTIVKTKEGFTFKLFASQNYCEKREDWENITKYSWKLLPIGGSCMMLGEDMNLDDERAFNKKGVWARISVIAAGPIFNFILAFVLAMIIIGTIGYRPAKVDTIAENYPAQEAGVEEGDIIKKINGDNISIGAEYDVYFTFNPLTGENVTLTVERDGKEKELSINPNFSTYRLGYSYNPNDTSGKARILSIDKDWPMDKAGIKEGDIITAIGTTTINNNQELQEYLAANSLTDQPVFITYERDGKEATIEVTPELYESKTLGIYTSAKREKVGVIDVVKYSAIEVKYWIETTVKSVGMLITGKVKTEELSGPVGIVNIIGDSYESSKAAGGTMVLLNLLNMCILLSANLGVMNLLPIPALDGGRLVFLLIEAIRGKPIDQEKEGIVHLVGLVALMALMVFVTYNDILRIFS